MEIQQYAQTKHLNGAYQLNSVRNGYRRRNNYKINKHNFEITVANAMGLIFKMDYFVFVVAVNYIA